MLVGWIRPEMSQGEISLSTPGPILFFQMGWYSEVIRLGSRPIWLNNFGPKTHMKVAHL